LEEMIVVTIDESHAHVGATKRARGEEAAETAAEDYNARRTLNHEPRT
jgi:hypothetical protein